MQGSSLTDDQKARLNKANLIIVSRNTNSGNYKALDWHSIEVPIMVCNGQIARSSRWQFFGSTTISEIKPPRAQVQVPVHPIFNGITLEANDSLVIYDSTVAVVIFSADAGQNNGTVLAKSDASLMIVEWNNKSKVYNDATTQMPAAVRMFFATAGEMNLTSNGIKVYLNAVKYLLSNPAVTSVESAEDILPGAFNLSQNYPNPFNPTTNINISIPTKGSYKLAVFNVLGQEIATLINSELNAGVHNVTFEAVNLNSGIYFYTLTGNNVNITRKMILLK
jgi:hypothetical protein